MTAKTRKALVLPVTGGAPTVIDLVSTNMLDEDTRLKEIIRPGNGCLDHRTLILEDSDTEQTYLMLYSSDSAALDRLPPNATLYRTPVRYPICGTAVLVKARDVFAQEGADGEGLFDLDATEADLQRFIAHVNANA